MGIHLPATQKVEQLPDFDALPAHSRHSFLLSVARAADGAEIGLPINLLVGGSAHPRLLVVAGVHGDEYEGILAQLALWHALDMTELRGTLALVPIANPPAFRAQRRRNPEDQIDMNRIFPGDAAGTITHRLAHRLFHDLLPGTDLLLSMHGWSADGMITPYVEYPKRSPVTERSRQVALAFGVAYIEAFDWLPGLLVAAANRIGIPAIEPEIGGLASTRTELQALYQRGVLNVMRHIGSIATVRMRAAVAPGDTVAIVFAPL